MDEQRDLRTLILEKDWSQTVIGDRETWSPALRMVVDYMLSNRFPHLLWWGPDYVSIYNDAYRPILGTKHPWALGLPFRDVWSEIAHVLLPLIDAPYNGGPATWMDDILLEVNRHGFIEETHFTIGYSPVPDETAPRGIGGVMATVYEITEKVVGERRIAALRDLGAKAGEGKTAEEACRLAAEALAPHDKDVPFALMYLVDTDGQAAHLAAAAGVSPHSPLAPAHVKFSETGADIWRLCDVFQNRQAADVECPQDLMRGAHVGPWSDPPNTAVVVPIKATGDGPLAGFLVAVVSPRLRLDDQYRSFLDLVATQIAAAVANARAYEEERKRAEALAEIDRAKTLFFSNVSHEFRTPLSLILGPLTDAVSSGEAVQGQQLDLIHRNSLRLLKLVNSLLEFSRIEAGRAEAFYEPTDLGQLTSDLASNFRSACERAGLTLTVTCLPLSAPVYVDRDMWEKIVLNLLSNAFKFTFTGGIAMTLREVDGQVELRVSDTGGGIAPDDIQKIFARFHRIQGQKSRTHEGSGIGLALVQELVKLHSGSIGVESEVGRGTSFTVTLPFGSAVLMRHGATSRSLSTAVRAEAFVQEALRWLPNEYAEPMTLGTLTDASEALGNHKSRRILLADDNADMREYIRRLLGDKFDVRAAADGRAALQEMHLRPPDLLLADVMMPGMDGFELLREVRADPKLRDIPIILLSARAGEESRVEGLDAGANDYLVKPFSARELIARVSSNLELARMRRESTEVLRQNEERFRAFVTASADVVYRMSPDWSEMRFLDGKEFIADTHEPNHAWMNTYIHPDDQGLVMNAIQRAIRDKRVFELEHRVLQVDGSLGWTVSRAIPLFDASGEIAEWFGTATDVTARHQQEDRQKMLLNELNHRVKNTLATIQSIAAQTLRTAKTPADARGALDARLIALSKAHDVLTRKEWSKADLREIVMASMSPYIGSDDDRLEIDGEALTLRPRAALALSMAFHELCTNATKYGALSNNEGRVFVTWRCRDDRFELVWREEGGPAVTMPTSRGFGSRLIERGLSMDLSGQAELSFPPAGVTCKITAPVHTLLYVSAQVSELIH